MLEVLTDPNGFFRKKINEKVEWKTPLIIMTIMAIVSAISAYMVTAQIMKTMPQEAATFAGIGAAIGIIGGIIGVIIGWVMYSLVFYIISLLFNGEGDFKRVMQFVSYGFIPSIASSLISLYYTNKMFSNIDFSSIDPQTIQEILVSDPSMKIAGIIGIIFTLWSANIWIFGIMYARNLSFKNALITVGVPILIYILYSVYSLKLINI